MNTRSLQAKFYSLVLLSASAVTLLAQAPEMRAPAAQSPAAQFPAAQSPTSGAADPQAPPRQTAPPLQSEPAPGSDGPRTVLRTTVRRVVLDVIATDGKGGPVSGLTRDDFLVTENGEPQQILSFDANGFSPAMDYVPPSLPPQPAGTFINLPATPEKGPLYVLLYDLTNMDSVDQQQSPDDHRIQMISRQQIIKFIQSKPEGARFAIFARTDGVHLIQGFTSDKAVLYNALDPHHPRPHLPMIWLMGTNFGRGDKISALDTLHTVATFLDGLPGRKNLIWFSSAFPLSFFADENDGARFREETKATMDLLAHNQIAVYPVDARGVSVADARGAISDGVRNGATTGSSGSLSGGTSVPPGGSGGQVGTGSDQANSGSQVVLGPSMIQGSYSTLDEIARETGGHAFYGTNDVAGELVKATESGAAYYTLTYSSTNKNYDGALRRVDVTLKKKGPELGFRHFYYATESGQPGVVAAQAAAEMAKAADAPGRKVGDSLSANMQHGAPEAHQLLFVVQAHRVGAPEQGTPEQMAELATEPAYFKVRHHGRATDPLTPVPLQKHLVTFQVPTRQFKDEGSLDVELAAAAYNADGQLMNAVVRIAKKDLKADKTDASEAPRFFRFEQELEVPVAATTVRFAVRDVMNDRTGAMEVELPLPDAGSPLAASH